MLRKYETFFIVDPDLADDVGSAVDEKLKNVVSGNGGEVISYVPWGKKKLAYPVKKRTRGSYILMEYVGGSDLVAELERIMRLDERVLKFITVKLDDRYDPEKEAALKAAENAASEENEEVSDVSDAGDETTVDEAAAVDEDFPVADNEE